jgi:hypothetical protein
MCRFQIFLSLLLSLLALPFLLQPVLLALGPPKWSFHDGNGLMFNSLFEVGDQRTRARRNVPKGELSWMDESKESDDSEDFMEYVYKVP